MQTFFILLYLLYFSAGSEKAGQCKHCIINLDVIHEELLLSCAKFDKITADDLQVISKFKADTIALNEKAEDHMDACKLVKNKLKNYLQSQ